MFTFLSPETKSSRMLEGLTNLVMINFLWLIFSIPIFTMGASTTAMYSVIFKMHKKEDGSIVKNFSYAFIQNFKTATLTWFIVLASFIVLIVDGYFLLNVPPTIIKWLLGALLLCIGGLGVSMIAYLFPLLSQFENTVTKTATNAFIMTLACLPYGLFFLGLDVFPFWILWKNPQVFPNFLFFYLAFGFSCSAWIKSYVLQTIFKKYPKNLKKS